ncbi:hypothetical protein HII31_00627 [Pseudocercospora fuligena]|uniref:Uncharacterized protein n=1 Tax=Pseudocercospora fuligena TaxID=685502 RepID=A0A8H6RV35_9PEZI|nr:hypothetical protein HII31_00627 [Pseudocercospora fuligena]
MHRLFDDPEEERAFMETDFGVPPSRLLGPRQLLQEITTRTQAQVPAASATTQSGAASTASHTRKDSGWDDDQLSTALKNSLQDVSGTQGFSVQPPRTHLGFVQTQNGQNLHSRLSTPAGFPSQQSAGGFDSQTGTGTDSEPAPKRMRLNDTPSKPSSTRRSLTKSTAFGGSSTPSLPNRQPHGRSKLSNMTAAPYSDGVYQPPTTGSYGVVFGGPVGGPNQALPSFSGPQLSVPYTGPSIPAFNFLQQAVTAPPPSSTYTGQLLPLTDLSKIVTGGKRDRLIVNVLRQDVQPLLGHTITIVEINTFNPHWNLFDEVAQRSMQNGFKPEHIAIIQLKAGLPPLDEFTKRKVSNKTKKQHSSVGIAHYGAGSDGRWHKERAEAKGPWDDLTADKWGTHQSITFGHVKLSAIYDPITAANWPAGNDRGVTSKCLEWARANRQQFPNLTTRDWDWIVTQLGPRATTPATPQRFSNLDQEAKDRLGF